MPRLKISDRASQHTSDHLFIQDRLLRDAMIRRKPRPNKSKVTCSYPSTDCFIEKDGLCDPQASTCPTKQTDAATEQIPYEARQSDVDWWRAKIRRGSGTVATSISATITSSTITSSSESSHLNEETVSVQTTLSGLTMGSRKAMGYKLVEAKLSSLIPDVICFKITKRRRFFGFLRGRRTRPRGKVLI